MSFFNKLGKFAGIAGAIGGAPFTGGASLSGLPLFLKAGSDVAGAFAKSKAGDRQSQLDYNLATMGFNREAPFLRQRAAVGGDIAAGVQPFRLEGSGRDITGSGGLSPTLIGPGTRQLGQDISRQALLSQLGQLKNDPYTAAPLPKAGKLEKVLGILGGAGPALSLFRK